MCGINGFIVKSSQSYDLRARIDIMNSLLSHRGPDDSGVSGYDFGGGYSVVFGQARLSIIDLSLRGHQPMFYTHGFGASNEKFSYHDEFQLEIVFNGEIYNYKEIRKELELLGYIFSTESDTEVILAGYYAWGTDVVKKFNGMWAFAIYDKRDNIVFCSRDRFGKKPFYYFHDSEHFIFSSELKAILGHDELLIQKKENIDPKAIDFYLTSGFIPAPLTIYTSVKKLEAGTNLVMKLGASGLEIQTSRYYEIPAYTPIKDKKQLLREGMELLEDATKIRMFSSDVPVGAFLSGGLDSSAVVATMTHLTDRSKLHTFSVGFEGKYDESQYVNIVKNQFKTVHHHQYFHESDFLGLVDTIAYHYDEPFGDYSSFPTTFVSRLAREHVTVALSGDGGDEIFGGYLMHRIAAQMNLLYKLPLSLRKYLSQAIPEGKHNLSLLSKMKEAFRVSLFPKEDFYAELGSSTLYRPETYKEWTRERLKYLLNRNSGNFIQSIIDFDLLFNTIPDNFLVKVDRASMSQSLEVRSPFLDFRFVEFAKKIPTKWKVSLRKSKILMREMIRYIVPKDIIHRGKQGFEPPIGEWIMKNEYGELLSTGLEELFAKSIISAEWYKFYKDSVLVGENKVFIVFKIKLFLLLKWKEKWLP